MEKIVFGCGKDFTHETGGRVDVAGEKFNYHYYVIGNTLIVWDKDNYTQVAEFTVNPATYSGEDYRYIVNQIISLYEKNSIQ